MMSVFPGVNQFVYIFDEKTLGGETARIALASASLPVPDPSPQANHLTGDLPGRIKEVWRLRWGNKWKEIRWRLLLHGVPGAGGHEFPWARGSECVCRWRAADSATCEV
eukprot:1152441-Pelagomonas_calceolata.AAC.1